MNMERKGHSHVYRRSHQSDREEEFFSLPQRLFLFGSSSGRREGGRGKVGEGATPSFTLLFFSVFCSLLRAEARMRLPSSGPSFPTTWPQSLFSFPGAEGFLPSSHNNVSHTIACTHSLALVSCTENAHAMLIRARNNVCPLRADRGRRGKVEQEMSIFSKGAQKKKGKEYAQKKQRSVGRFCSSVRLFTDGMCFIKMSSLYSI